MGRVGCSGSSGSFFGTPIRISDFVIALSVVYILKLVKDGCDTFTTCKADNQVLHPESGSYAFTARLFVTSLNLSNMRINNVWHKESGYHNV